MVNMYENIADFIYYRLGMINMEYDQETLYVLIVDDEEDNAQPLTKHLSVYNFNIEQAFSIEETLSLFRRVQYDVIFISDGMKDISGLQLVSSIRKIRKEKDRTVIFILTTPGAEEINKKYEKAGVNDFIEKPVKQEQLMDVIRKWFPSVMAKLYRDGRNSRPPYEFLSKVIGDIGEIDFDTCMKYVSGNVESLLHVLKVSLMDIQSFLMLAKRSTAQAGLPKLLLHVNGLSSIFLYLGADSLHNEALMLKSEYSNGEWDLFYANLPDFLIYLEHFADKLKMGLKQMEELVLSSEPERKKKVPTLTGKDYEQGILNAIYYIKSYEYDFIINELDRLILSGSKESAEELKKALKEIKEFKYDKALKRLLKMTGNNDESKDFMNERKRRLPENPLLDRGEAR